MRKPLIGFCREPPLRGSLSCRTFLRVSTCGTKLAWAEGDAAGQGSQPTSWRAVELKGPIRVSTPSGLIWAGLYTPALSSQWVDCPRKDVTLCSSGSLAGADTWRSDASLEGRSKPHTSVCLLSSMDTSQPLPCAFLSSLPSTHPITSYSTQNSPLWLRVVVCCSVALVHSGLEVW